MANNIDILIFGSKFSGKSSLVKLLISENPIYAEKKSYKTLSGTIILNETIYKHNEQQYVFTELESFNLNQNNINYTFELGCYKENFLEYCSNSKKSFNFLIHVIKRQSILETDQINYEIVTRNLFKNKAITMCVVTFSEEVIDLTKYWRQHRRDLNKRDFRYYTGLAVCCGYASNPFFEMGFKQQRDLSYKLLWKTINGIALNSKKIAPPKSSLFDSISSVWQYFSRPLNENTQNDEKVNDRYIIWIFGQNDEDINDFVEDMMESLQVSFSKKIYYRFKSIRGFDKDELLKLTVKNIIQNIDATNIFILMNDIHESIDPKILNLINFFKSYFPSEVFLLLLICSNLNIYNHSKSFIKKRKIELEPNNNFQLVELIIRSLINQKDFELIDENFKKVINQILDKLNKNQKIVCKHSINQIYKSENWSNRINFENDKIDLDLYECALFADCSKLNEKSLEKIKKRWTQIKLETKENENGYFGLCFFKEYSEHVLVVIAHRGTQFDRIGNVLSDLQIALKEPPIILEDALEYEKKCIKEIKSFDKSIILIHVGFSLGGYIAAACVEKNSDRDIKKFAITLDAPGTILDSSNIPSTCDKIVNYFLSPNLVNTCNKHSGRMYQIVSTCESIPIPEEDYTTIDLENTSKEKLASEIEYTFQSHNLDFLLDIVKVYADLREVSEWPIAKNFQDKLNHQRSNVSIKYT